MVLRIVNRFEKISNDNFYQSYFSKHEPVIIENFFENEPIGAINTLDKSLEIFHDVELDVIEAYIDKYIREKSFIPRVRHWSYYQFIEHIKYNTDSKMCVRVYDTPKKIMNSLVIPRYCNVMRAFEPTSSSLFIAGHNTNSRLHFDNDHKHTLLYQVYGNKNAILIPVSQSKKLAPVLNMSWLLIDNFDSEDKLKFLDMVNGYHCILKPGDLLYIPMMMWHQLDYAETSMSINFKFGRNDYTKFLAENVHYDLYVQYISTLLDQIKSSDEQLISCFNDIKNNVQKSFSSSYKHYEYMKKVIIRNYNELVREEDRYQDYYVRNNEDLIEYNPELRKILENFQCYKRELSKTT